jgi:hypothetical protein
MEPNVRRFFVKGLQAFDPLTAAGLPEGLTVESDDASTAQEK